MLADVQETEQKPCPFSVLFPASKQLQSSIMKLAEDAPSDDDTNTRLWQRDQCNTPEISDLKSHPINIGAELDRFGFFCYAVVKNARSTENCTSLRKN